MTSIPRSPWTRLRRLQARRSSPRSCAMPSASTAETASRMLLSTWVWTSRLVGQGVLLSPNSRVDLSGQPIWSSDHGVLSRCVIAWATSTALGGFSSLVRGLLPNMELRSLASAPPNSWPCGGSSRKRTVLLRKVLRCLTSSPSVETMRGARLWLRPSPGHRKPGVRSLATQLHTSPSRS